MTRRDILIIKLGALGDVVMATGLVERILRHHAPRRCVLLTIPVYGLFGPTDWRRSHALGQRDRVLSLDRDETVFRKTRLADLETGHVLGQLERNGVL